MTWPDAEPDKAIEEAFTDRALQRLGLPSKEIIREAVAYGAKARSVATELHPKMTAGTNAWSETIYMLRVQLLPLGWKAVEERNVSMVLSPDGSKAIIVQTGDRNTGILGGEPPKSKNPKGQAVMDMVYVNDLTLFDLSEFNAKKGIQTWVLLIHPAKDETRFELSLPTQTGPHGRFSKWGDRVIFTPLPTDLSQDITVEPLQKTEDLEIKIERHA